jgi:hypothetical protein
LVWHDGFLAWKGEIAWPGTDRVEVLLDDQDRKAGFPVARQSLEWVRAHEPEIHRAVAAELLAWCNGACAPADTRCSGRAKMLRASGAEPGFDA